MSFMYQKFVIFTENYVITQKLLTVSCQIKRAGFFRHYALDVATVFVIFWNFIFFPKFGLWKVVPKLLSDSFQISHANLLASGCYEPVYSKLCMQFFSRSRYEHCGDTGSGAEPLPEGCGGRSLPTTVPPHPKKIKQVLYISLIHSYIFRTYYEYRRHLV